uniref:Activin_recp domain-containing protein n=1 Tax=Ascaris lumbricoides TaxID=6252 RepID=A0A0M3ITD0_ASCLU
MREITLCFISFLVPISALKCWELSEKTHLQDGRQLKRIHQKSCNENNYCVSAYKITHLENSNVLAMGCENEIESTIALPKCKTDGCFRTTYKKLDRLQLEDIEIAVCCCNVDLCYRLPQSSVGEHHNNLALPLSVSGKHQKRPRFDKPALARVARNTASGNDPGAESFLFYNEMSPTLSSPQSGATGSLPHSEGTTSIPVTGTTSAGVSLIHGEVILYLVCFVLSLQFLS